MPLRHPASGLLAQTALQVISPTAIFFRPVTGLAAAASQIPAKKMANQLRYGRGASGSFYGYSGVGYGGQIQANIRNFTPSLFVVPASQSLQKVAVITTYSESGPLRESSFNSNLPATLEEVPLPTKSLVPSGELVAGEAGGGSGLENTDSQITIWQPSTGGLWELGELNLLNYGGKIHAHSREGYGATCGYGGHTTGVGSWNGIWTPDPWGCRATGLTLNAGVITMQDLVEVLEGKKIKHAIGVFLLVEAASTIVAPATRQDSSPKSNPVEKIPAGSPGEGEPNPAFGSVDAVALSSWFRFPPSSNASEYFNHATEPLGWAIYEAIREVGMFPMDEAEAPGFQFEPPIVMGSPYAFNVINPLANAEGTGWPSKGQMSYASSMPTGVTAGTLYGYFQENVSGSSSVFAKQPWTELESIEARAS